ncbi:GGDEF domain-containing protein [Aquihabitans sp. G128]|uniref:bifunctional diguanylate cyclase/phosphodiesterase n=1 Tax=Aquihabitans sp. G128 TaxID=2849779 RepID=UPI001C225B6C|nr:GGDEF domain-containing protein [Aquihabitans sp. G128]QXC59961.1 GGDEF domain-containing protein [Aquihabitans sp. G128]
MTTAVGSAAALRRQLAAVTELSRLDPLTGLANQRRLDDLAPAWGSRSLAVVVAELDGLPRIAAELGQRAADDALRQVAARLAPLPAGWVAARDAGTRLLVVVPVVDLDEDGPTAARHLAELLAAPARLGARAHALDALLGVAEGQPGDRLADLVDQAGACCTLARDLGVRGPVHWGPHVGRAAAIRRDLASSLGADAFEVVHQPQVQLVDGSVVGTEALLRWNHPVHGPVHPQQFMDLAEHFGLVQGLGPRVLATALEQLDDIDPARRLHLAINLSPQELGHPDVVADLEETWDRASGPGRARRTVCLEITETARLAGIGGARAAIDGLRAAGFRISFDDFGTGLGAIDALVDHRVDELKVDRRVVAHLPAPPAEALIEGLGLVCRRLGLVLVAEGIDDPSQPPRLAALGCTLGQGYLWSPAQRGADLGRWLAERV